MGPTPAAFATSSSVARFWGDDLCTFSFISSLWEAYHKAFDMKAPLIYQTFTILLC